MKTIGDYVNDFVNIYSKAGVEDSLFDVLAVISAKSLKRVSEIRLNFDKPFDYLGVDIDSMDDCLERHLNGEPIEYITGIAWFYNEKYFVGQGVLIPRPDSELLVEKALEVISNNSRFDSKKITLADLCTGSGCVGISLTNALIKNDFEVCATLIDIEDEALSYCRINVERQLIKSNKAQCLVLKADVNDESTWDELGKLDLLVSNPPYIDELEMRQLDSSVINFEPSIALYGGQDGLNYYRTIAKSAKSILVSDGVILFEHGYLQGAAVRKILENEGYKDVNTFKDYGGNDRVTIGVRA